MSLRRRPNLLSLLLVGFSAAFAGEASAQRARGYQADEYDRSLSSRGAIVRRYMQSGDGDRAEFERYFSQYYFPVMTQPSADALGGLGKLSGDLFRNYIHSGRGDAQKWLSDQALAWGKRVASDSKYHPAVRLNAILVVGRIDDVYNRDSPTPSAAANDLLCAVAQAGVTNPRTPRYLLTGALTGLERHTRHFSALPGPQKQKTARTLYGLLNADELPGDFEEGVRDWVYLQAATAFSNLGIVGPRGAFAAAIAKRAGDASLELDTRLEIAAMLEKLRGEAGSVPAGPLVKSITQLAKDTAERELEVAKLFEDSRLRGGRDPLSTEWKSRFTSSDSRDRGLSLVREPMVKTLEDLRLAVKATKRLAGDAGKAVLDKIAAAIDPALNAAQDTGVGELTVTDTIKQMAREIEEAASTALAPAE